MSRRISFAEAIREGIEQEMDRVKDIVYFGIDVRQSPWGFTRDLVSKFGRERIVNTPIAESAIVGTGIGFAMMGLRAVSELMFEDFTALAMDQRQDGPKRRRKAYRPPTLTCHGSLAALTQMPTGTMAP